MKSIKSIADLTPDNRNANQGTQRGRDLLEKSLRELGAGRSIVVDREGRTIAGNKTLTEWAAIANPDDVIVVQTDGHKLVVVQREDLDLEQDTKARQLAYADNRVGQVSLDWDVAQIVEDQASGIDLSGWWFDVELDQLLARASEPIDPTAEWVGMPEYSSEDQMAAHRVIVNFKTTADIEAFEQLIGQTVPKHVRNAGSIWFPKVEREKFNDLGYVSDES